MPRRSPAACSCRPSLTLHPFAPPVTQPAVAAPVAMLQRRRTASTAASDAEARPRSDGSRYRVGRRPGAHRETPASGHCDSEAGDSLRPLLIVHTGSELAVARAPQTALLVANRTLGVHRC